MEIYDVYNLIRQRASNDFDILKRKIDEFHSQGVSVIHIYNTMLQYIDLKPYCSSLDIVNGDYMDYIMTIKIATFLASKFNSENTLNIMQHTMIYNNNGVCIFKPTSFQESRVIGEPICCFANNQNSWNEHYNFNQEEIYFVYDVMRCDSDEDFVAITVRPNGRARVLDKNHNWWSSSDSIRYIKGLNDGASLILSKNGKTLKTENKEYKSNKNMKRKKQLVRLTEGDLHRIIKESVNNILSELDWKTYQSGCSKSI